MCLFAFICCIAMSRENPNAPSYFSTNSSTGISWYPVITPCLSFLVPPFLYQGWALIYSIVYLSSGLVFRIFYIKSFASARIKLGIWYFPAMIFWYSFFVFLSSKGRYPHNMAYIITPQLQISTCNPLYFFPPIISGAA